MREIKAIIKRDGRRVEYNIDKIIDRRVRRGIPEY